MTNYCKKYYYIKEKLTDNSAKGSFRAVRLFFVFQER